MDHIDYFTIPISRTVISDIEGDLLEFHREYPIDSISIMFTVLDAIFKTIDVHGNDVSIDAIRERIFYGLRDSVLSDYIYDNKLIIAVAMEIAELPAFTTLAQWVRSLKISCSVDVQDIYRRHGVMYVTLRRWSLYSVRNAI